MPKFSDSFKEKLNLYKTLWKSLKTDQKVSLTTMLALLVALPLATLTTLTYTTFFSRANFPATPPSTPPTDRPLCGFSTIPPQSGDAPLAVTLFGSASANGLAYIEGYRWDFENDGTWDTGVNINPVTHVYETSGIYQPKFQVYGTNGSWSDVCNYLYDIVVGPVTSPPVLTTTPTPRLPNDAPKIITSAARIGQRGRDFSTTISARDVNGHVMLMTAEGLPPGIQLQECRTHLENNGISNMNCVFSGIPTQSGLYRSTITVKDVLGESSSRRVNFIILPSFGQKTPKR